MIVGVTLVVALVGMQGTQIFSSEPLRLTNDPADDRQPAWHPDGTRLIFESNRHGNWDLFVLNLDGATRQLTNAPADDRYPAWDPSGRRVVFQSTRTGAPELHVLDVASSSVTPIATIDGEEIFPSWSPLGDTIAFSLVTESGLDIYAIAVDGGGLRRLTSHPSRDVWPRWSPAGDELVFFSRRDTQERDDEVYVLRVTTAEVRRITHTPGHDFTPAWSPDGDRIAIAHSSPAGNRSIRILELDGTVVGELGTGFEGITEPAFSPGGNQLAFAGRRGGRYDVYVVTLTPQAGGVP